MSRAGRPVVSDPLRVRLPSGNVTRIQDVPLPPPLGLDLDVLALLREERSPEP